MFKKLKKLLTSRILWVSLILLAEIALILLFVYAIIGTFMVTLNLKAWQIWIIVLVVLYFISFCVVVYIVNSHAKADYKIAWLIVVALIPFLGCFFYVFFGNKKISSRQKKRMLPIYNFLTNENLNQSIKTELTYDNQDALKIVDYIKRVSGADIYEHSKVNYYPSGESVYQVILDELNKAKDFIFIEYFIIAPGKFWDSIYKILLEKVKQGVDVRLIYDDLGCAGTLPHNFDKTLNSQGIKTLAFHRFKPLLDVKLNNRDHRKILVIDGKVGFTGGINIADEYINEIKRFGYWKDNAIKIEGDAVIGLTKLFLSQWFYLTNVDLENINFTSAEYHKYFSSSSEIVSDGFIQTYGDLPYDEESVGEGVYLNLINRANKYIYITTPYLIIDEEISNALISAARKGIDVRIVTPRIPDKKIIFRITRSYYRNLLKNGVKIFEYLPGFIHMKMFVVDDIYATVGTINLDYRSLYLHLENATFLYKSSSIIDMKKDFTEIFNASEEITYEAYKKHAAPRRLLWAILRLFAPLF